jgi:hypothetical protein
VTLVIGGVLGAACSGVSGSVLTSPRPAAPVELVLFHADKEGFSIGYPAGWIQEDIPGVAVAFADRQHASGGFAPNVNVVVERLPSSHVTQDEYTRRALAEVENLITNFGHLVQTRAQLSGRPATEITYTGSQGKFDLRWLQVYLVVGSRAFVVTFTALPVQFDETEEPLVRSILASFTLD